MVMYMRSWFRLTIIKWLSLAVDGLLVASRPFGVLRVSLPLALCMFMFVSAGAHAWTAEIIWNADTTTAQPGDEIKVSLSVRITYEAGESEIGLAAVGVPIELNGLSFVGIENPLFSTTTDLLDPRRPVISFSEAAGNVRGLSLKCNAAVGASCDTEVFEVVILAVSSTATGGSTASLQIVRSTVSRSLEIQALFQGRSTNMVAADPSAEIPLGSPLIITIVQPLPQVSLALSAGDDPLVVGATETDPAHILNVTLEDSGADTFPSRYIAGFTIDASESVDGFQFLLRDSGGGLVAMAPGTADGVSFSYEANGVVLPDGESAEYSIHVYGGRIGIMDGADITFGLVSSASHVVGIGNTTIASTFDGELSEEPISFNVVASRVEVNGIGTWDLGAGYDVSNSTGRDNFGNLDTDFRIENALVTAQVGTAAFAPVAVTNGLVAVSAYTADEDRVAFNLQARVAGSSSNPLSEIHAVTVSVSANTIVVANNADDVTALHAAETPIAGFRLEARGNGKIDTDVGDTVAVTCDSSHAAVDSCSVNIMGSRVFAAGVYTAAAADLRITASLGNIATPGEIASITAEVSGLGTVELLANPIDVIGCEGDGLMLAASPIDEESFMVTVSGDLCQGTASYTIYYAPLSDFSIGACPADADASDVVNASNVESEEFALSAGNAAATVDAANVVRDTNYCVVAGVTGISDEFSTVADVNTIVEAAMVELGGESDWDLSSPYVLSAVGTDGPGRVDSNYMLSGLEARVGTGLWTAVTPDSSGNVPVDAYTADSDRVDFALRVRSAGATISNVFAVTVNVVADTINVVSEVSNEGFVHNEPAVLTGFRLQAENQASGKIDTDEVSAVTLQCNLGSGVSECTGVRAVMGFEAGVYTAERAQAEFTATLADSTVPGSVSFSIISGLATLSISADEIPVIGCTGEGLMLATSGRSDEMSFEVNLAGTLCEGTAGYTIYYMPRSGANCPAAANDIVTGGESQQFPLSANSATATVTADVVRDTNYCVVARVTGTAVNSNIVRVNTNVDATMVELTGVSRSWDLTGPYGLRATGTDNDGRLDSNFNATATNIIVEASVDGGAWNLVTLDNFGGVPVAAYTDETDRDGETFELRARVDSSGQNSTPVVMVEVDVVAAGLRIEGMIPDSLTHNNGVTPDILIQAVDALDIVDTHYSGDLSVVCVVENPADFRRCTVEFVTTPTLTAGEFDGQLSLTAVLDTPTQQSTITQVTIQSGSFTLDLLSAGATIAVNRCMAEGLMIVAGEVGVYNFSLMDPTATSTALCPNVLYDIYYAPRTGGTCPTDPAMVRNSGIERAGRMPNGLTVPYDALARVPNAGTNYCVVLYAEDVASQVLPITTLAYEPAVDTDGDGLPDALDTDPMADENAVYEFLGGDCSAANQLCDVNGNNVPDVAELYYGRPGLVQLTDNTARTMPVQADSEMAAVPSALSGARLHSNQGAATTQVGTVATVAADTQLEPGTYWLSLAVGSSVTFTRLDIYPAVRGHVLLTAQNLASATEATHNLFRVWLLGRLPLDENNNPMTEQEVTAVLNGSQSETPITAVVGSVVAVAAPVAPDSDAPSSLTLGWMNAANDAAGASTYTTYVRDSLSARQVQDRAVLEAADGVGTTFTLSVTILGGGDFDDRLAGVQLSVTNGNCAMAEGSVMQSLQCTVDSGATGSVVIALISSGSVIVGETSVLIGSPVANDADLDRLSGNDGSDQRVYFGSNWEDNNAAAGRRNYLEAAPGVRVRAGVIAARDSAPEGIQYENAAGDAMIDFELYCTSDTAACRNQRYSDVVVLYFSRDQEESDVAGPQGADRQVASATAGACPAPDATTWAAPQTGARYQCYRFAADFRISGADRTEFGTVPSRIPTFDAFGGTGGGGGGIGLFSLLALFGLSAMSFLFGALRRRVFTAAAAILAVPLFAGLMSSQAVAQTSVGELMDGLSDVRLSKLRVGFEYGFVGYDREYTGSALVNGEVSEIGQREVDDSDSGYRLSASWDVDGNRNSGLAIDVFWADYGGSELRDTESDARAAVDIDGYGIGLSWYFPLNFGEMTGVGGDGSFYVGFGYADTDASVPNSDEIQFVDSASDSTYLEFGVVWEELIPVDNLAVKLSYHWFDDAGIDFFGVGVVYDFGEPSGAAADRPRRRAKTEKPRRRATEAAKRQQVGPQPKQQRQQRRSARRRAASSTVATGGICANWNTCRCQVPLSGNPKGWYVQIVAYKSSDGQRIRNMERRLSSAGYRQVVTTEKSGSLGRLTLIRIGDPNSCSDAESVKRRVDRMFDVDSLIRPYYNSPK